MMFDITVKHLWITVIKLPVQMKQEGWLSPTERASAG